MRTSKMGLLFFCLVLWACSNTQDQTKNQSSDKKGWQLVFRNDAEGRSLAGDKTALIHAVRNGYPIRIGWGMRRASDTTRSVEHVVDAAFLTISNSREVFAQTVQIIGQAPDLNSDTLKIRFREQNKWVKMAGTNGYSTALMINYLQDTLVNHGVDRKLGTSWYVNYGILPPPEATPPALWD